MSFINVKHKIEKFELIALLIEKKSQSKLFSQKVMNILTEFKNFIYKYLVRTKIFQKQHSSYVD